MIDDSPKKGGDYLLVVERQAEEYAPHHFVLFNDGSCSGKSKPETDAIVLHHKRQRALLGPLTKRLARTSGRGELKGERQVHKEDEAWVRGRTCKT